MAPALDITGVTKTYRGRRVLGPVDLRVDRGDYRALLGPNGAGKSTLLHIAMGLVPPSTGTIRIAGRTIDDAVSRLDLGFAPDDLPLPGSLTGKEYLEFHDRMRHRDDRDRWDELARLFHLDDALDRQVDEYSHGMRRKLQFIAAVAHEPTLLVLDEPFRGLDPRSVLVLRRFLENYVDAGRAVVVATHDMVRAERDCRSVTLLDQGDVVATGTPDSIRALAGDAANLELAFDLLTTDEEQAEAADALLLSLSPRKGSDGS